MMRALLVSFVGTLLIRTSGAEEFSPPQQYPVSRYEAGWQKNPFTLKTAPISIQKESFAKDLVLGSITRIGDATKLVVINTKTRDRMPLQDKADNPDGIKVKAVHLENARKDTFVELERNGETAVVRYDEGLLKQLVARQPKQGEKPATSPAEVAAKGGDAPKAAEAATGTVPPKTQSGTVSNAPNTTPPPNANRSPFPASGSSAFPPNMSASARRRMGTLPVSVPPR